MKDKPDRAPIIAPPPLLGVGCIVLGFILNHYKPLPLFPSRGLLAIALGAVLIAISFAIIFSARRVFIAHGEHPSPYRPTNAIVVTGVYKFSRNPIYVAFLLVVLAFGLFANSVWFLVMAALLFVLLQFGVVKREELYLSEKFGETYRSYCHQVRRWI